VREARLADAGLSDDEVQATLAFAGKLAAPGEVLNLPLSTEKEHAGSLADLSPERPGWFCVPLRRSGTLFR
jgi:hypothetical protein